MNTTNNNSPTFFGLNIAPGILKQIEHLHFQTPTPIQLKAIPSAIQGEDLIGIAQTGTGKTLAFGIPMLQRISVTKGKGLVIVPTRELAIQVDEALQQLGRVFGLRTAVLIGGASMNLQVKAVRKNPHVIIATPGRLIDHLEQRTLTLSKFNILVLDEADRMLDMGFEPQIKKILAAVPADRQTMLFSATMPGQISLIAKKYMKQPLRVEVAPSGTAAERVDQEVFIVSKNDKIRLLETLLNEYHGTVLVFSRTKFGAKKIAASVRRMGHLAAEIHSNRSLSQRRDALDGFKSGKYRVLVATDIAARGIDVVGIELVVNFDLPDQPEDYVHRIGRTGRAGLGGKAISFAAPEQKQDLRSIEHLTRLRLPVKPLPPLPALRASLAPERAERTERPARSNYGGQRPAGKSYGGQRPQRSGDRPFRPAGRSKRAPRRFVRYF